jgi:hypothetical protein
MLISTAGQLRSRAAQNILTPVCRPAVVSAHARRAVHARHAAFGTRHTLTYCLSEAPWGADQNLLRDAVPVILDEELCVHSRERSRLLHLEEGSRGRSNEVLWDTGVNTGVRTLASDAGRAARDPYRVEEALVEQTLPAKGVEFSEEFIASVHVIHGTQFGFPGFRQPRVYVCLCLHELFFLLHAVLQRGYQPWYFHLLLLLCFARYYHQVFNELQHAVVWHLHHAPCIWIYTKKSLTQIRTSVVRAFYFEKTGGNQNAQTETFC